MICNKLMILIQDGITYCQCWNHSGSLVAIVALVIINITQPFNFSDNEFNVIHSAASPFEQNKTRTEKNRIS